MIFSSRMVLVLVHHVVLKETKDELILRTWTGEALVVDGDEKLDHDAVVSLRGVFESEHEIRIIELYEHEGRWRDYAAYAGLGLLAAIWCWVGWLPRAGSIIESPLSLLPSSDRDMWQLEQPTPLSPAPVWLWVTPM